MDSSRSVCVASALTLLVVAGCSGPSAPLDPSLCVPAGATTSAVRALSGLPGEVAAFAFLEGVAIVVVDGRAYSQDPTTCVWSFLREGYDPAYYTDNFYREGGVLYRVLPSGDFPLSSEFGDDFEDGTSIADLVDDTGGRYTSLVLLSPLTPTIREYNDLRDCLLATTCDFRDNRIDFDSAVVHGGSQSLRFYAVPPSAESQTSKALVERGLYSFTRGEDMYFSAWYWAEGTAPFTILDLETSGIEFRPGLRITIRGGALSAELKFLDKPTYEQDPGSVVLFPLDRWVHVEVHLLLSEDETGRVEIWQDGEQVLDQNGRTLPTSDSILDVLQIGITATSEQSTLWVDDVQVSGSPIPPG